MRKCIGERGVENACVMASLDNADARLGTEQGSRRNGLSIFPLFRSLDAADLTGMEARCIHRRCKRNDWIVEVNETNDDVFFIQSGVVRLQSPKVGTREVVFQDLQAQDFFGGVSAFHHQPRQLSALAVTDVAVIVMPGSLFKDALHDHPDVCDQFIERMAEEIRYLFNRVNEFSTLDVRHRIYAELMRLSRPKMGSGHGAVISPPPRQADIAARIGTRREPVVREMKALERAGLLRRSRGALEIIDLHRLQDLIENAETVG